MLAHCILGCVQKLMEAFYLKGYPLVCVETLIKLPYGQAH